METATGCTQDVRVEYQYCIKQLLWFHIDLFEMYNMRINNGTYINIIEISVEVFQFNYHLSSITIMLYNYTD